jgi:hypothetical protein
LINQINIFEFDVVRGAIDEVVPIAGNLPQALNSWPDRYTLLTPEEIVLVPYR